MDGCVIHHDHGVAVGERLHLVEQIGDESGKKVTSNRAVKDVEMENPIKGYCREDRITMRI